MTALQCSLKSLKQNMTDSLTEWVTRSPIELSWTAKKETWNIIVGESATNMPQRWAGQDQRRRNRSTCLLRPPIDCPDRGVSTRLSTQIKEEGGMRGAPKWQCMSIQFTGSHLGTHDEALVGRSFTWPRLHDKHLQDVTIAWHTIAWQACAWNAFEWQKYQNHDGTKPWHTLTRRE